MPPRTSTVGVKDIFLWSLLLPVIGALQQQPYQNAYPSKASSDSLSKDAAAAARYYRAAAADSLHTSLSGQRGFRDTHVDKNKSRRTRSSSNERALATLSPAESNPAVRAPPAYKSSVPTGGISTRQAARSLQDWQVEDIILLATVDGNLHARDRKTGAARWQLETDRPMVETVYHRYNKSLDENGPEQEDPLWIVEPSQDGSIYVYAPGSGFGVQKLQHTVKELAELAPYATEGHPAVTYTADKKTELHTVNAATGHILKTFGSGGSIVNEDRSCRRVSPLEPLDENECEAIGILTLGRIEYTIGIQDRDTGEPISTIKYFEWAPNNRDSDLSSKYRRTMDNKYVYTRHNGLIFGLELGSDNYSPVPVHKTQYQHKFSSPVARVFDIMRPYDDSSSDAPLVILPQPVGPSPNDLNSLEEDAFESVFVNCTADGSWYALSERNYPTVTDGAATANYYSDEALSLPSISWPMSKWDREKFIGVHQLSPPNAQQASHLIDAPESPPSVEPPQEHGNEIKGLIEAPASFWDNMPSVRALLALVVLGLVGCAVVYQQQIGAANKLLPSHNATNSVGAAAASEQIDPGSEQQPMVRESEPAKETIFPHDADGTADRDTDAQIAHDASEKVEADDAVENDSAKDLEEPKQKKKATRGKRGGRKQKEKEQLQTEVQARRKDSKPPQPVEVISVAASESPQVLGPLQINSLVIHTDKVIGQGSCGTSVFEGSFEGRDVAVKRMLSQYYDLASQEVSFLQQSDDHPNVVRYFCQQKDDHFLYIAVELCQASLFEVWEAEKAREDTRQVQMRSLKHSIQQDVPKALQQLAAGLYHLHNLRIIHRDIKPQNILVAFPKRNQNNGPRLVISDFGLGKNLPENVSTLIDPTGNAGTSGWKAPELISQPKDVDSKHSQSNSHTGGSESANGTTSGVKRAADIFSLGCLFFWVLTDGIHPYEDENGWQQLRELNIKRDNKKMGVLERWSDSYEPMQLITSMLEHQPENRPTALQVLNHPFFWSPEKRLAFLCDCSDHFEREPRGVPDDNYTGDSWHLSLLEYRAEEVIGAPFERADFLSKLDRHFVDTLGKQRKYCGYRLLDLVRALRNKKNHYEDMPEDVKKRVGPLAGGYLSYWCNRFPRLLMACYEVVHEAGIQNNDRFKGYFASGVV
ncbi:bifunctional endoribonuclease/protein kinase ire1 [Vermiconidia calcicola]|uniref:Bifunctional endoribonuclease/protein kinase ire1 n=1 Tax=Vermiconidia calcicola TaxID=1690605 RepID=A0ACC3NM32_9PEZI|nr:bifunctional endoribonuclease/protein kinase ire1 [Vermiconidia calcicola]